MTMLESLEAIGPAPGTRGYPTIAWRDDMKITIVSDDMYTVAQITLSNSSGAVVATGTAKRHPLDKQNRELGQCLAVARAFQAYADRYASRAAALADPGPEPDAELVKAMRRANRAEAVKRKNEKRRAARDKFFREVYQPGSNWRPDAVDEWRGRAFGDWGAA